MKFLGFLALCLTVCWPVASPDVSGGTDCDGHAIALKCDGISGVICPERGNMWGAGVNSNTDEKDKKKDENSEFDCKVSGGDNCTGSTYAILAGQCTRVTPPKELEPAPLADPL